MVPHVLRTLVQVKKDGDYDNVHPRLSLKKHLESKGLIARLQAAHENSLESFNFFAVGIVASSSVAGMNKDTVLQIASLHLFCRVAFLGLYCLQNEDLKWLSVLRSLAWGTGTMCSSYLLCSAGKAWLSA